MTIDVVYVAFAMYTKPLGRVNAAMIEQSKNSAIIGKYNHIQP